MQDPLKSKYLAFVLTSAARAKLLEAFPPKYDKVIAHHITVQFNVTEEGQRMLNGPTPVCKVMAYGCDSKIDCVLVNLNKTCARPDGSWYHVTLSCSPTGEPVDSNAFLKANHGKEGALDWSVGEITLEGKLELVNK